MSNKKEKNNKGNHQKGPKSAPVSFKKMSPTEIAEFTARRAAGETEAAIAADFKRRKRA